MAESRGSTGGGSGAIDGSADQGQPAVEQIQEQATRLVDLGREQLNARIGAQKEVAAGALGTLATALREAGQQVGEQDQDPGRAQVARVVDAAAGQVEQAAEALRTQDIDQLVATVGDYARRQPAPFLAAAFALGFAGMRFFRSSTPPRRDRAITPYGAVGSPDWTDRYASGGAGSGYGFGYGSAGAYESGGVEDVVGYAPPLLPTAGLAPTNLAGGALGDDLGLAEIDIEVGLDELGGQGDARAGERGAGAGGR